MKEGQRFQLGYSTSITADEEYTLHISDKLELSGVAPCYVLESPPTLHYRLRHKVGGFRTWECFRFWWP
jgi:hypothetical protein